MFGFILVVIAVFTLDASLVTIPYLGQCSEKQSDYKICFINFRTKKFTLDLFRKVLLQYHYFLLDCVEVQRAQNRADT